MNTTREVLKKLFDENKSQNEIDLSSHKLNKDELNFIKNLLKSNMQITNIKFSDTFVNDNKETKKLFERIKKYLKENESLSQVAKILNENNTKTDLSCFDINVRMLEFVEKSVSIHSNIGLIIWKEMKSRDGDKECKRLKENIEKQLIIIPVPLGT